MKVYVKKDKALKLLGEGKIYSKKDLLLREFGNDNDGGTTVTSTDTTTPNQGLTDGVKQLNKTPQADAFEKTVGDEASGINNGLQTNSVAPRKVMDEMRRNSIPFTKKELSKFLNSL